MNATISVIVPCYNQAQFLSDALNSVLQQTCFDWECIIVNDGSEDNTEEIAKEYTKRDKRFKYLYKTNGGLSSARNIGIANSTGTYILPLDADDKIGHNYIAKALQSYNSNPEISLVYSDADFFGIKQGKWYLRPYSYKELLKSNMIFCSSVFKKKDFEKIGGYDEQLKRGYEDWDLYLRLLGPDSVICKLNEVHFHYRIKHQSMLKDISTNIEHELNCYIYNKYQHLYNAHFESPIALIRKLDTYEKLYKNSCDYKLGNKLINPIRSLRNFLKSVFK